MKNIEEIYLSTYFLIKLSKIKSDSVISPFIELLKTIISNDSTLEDNLIKYSSFLSELSNKTKGENDFSKYLKKIFDIEISKDTKEIESEIEILTVLSKISYFDLKEELIKKYNDKKLFLEKLPKYYTSNVDFNIQTLKVEDDFELFKNNRAFIFDNDLELKALDIVDKTKFYDLKGYVKQKKVLFENTKALLNGSKVNNILLYGDAGSGKSSSVRALLNEFSELRMVQIFKNNLVNLDKLYEKLKNVPYKFIIFADDISFSEDDNTFSEMKAILEGSLIQRPANITIYMTSNRRHLIKESFSSRMGDEIHTRDTINEMNSLSERFGINLYFEKPSKEEFINIMKELAKDNNICLDNEQYLINKLERLALEKGSRSPRVVRQFIDNLLAHIEI